MVRFKTENCLQHTESANRTISFADLKRPILAYPKRSVVTVISTVAMERTSKVATMVSLADWTNFAAPTGKDASNLQRNATTSMIAVTIPMNKIAVCS